MTIPRNISVVNSHLMPVEKQTLHFAVPTMHLIEIIAGPKLEMCHSGKNNIKNDLCKLAEQYGDGQK